MRNIIVVLIYVISFRSLAGPDSQSYKFKDSSGSYQLVLREKGGLGDRAEKFSSSIEVKLMEKNKVHVTLNDKTDGPGIQFLLDQTEITDLDGDGLVDPIFIYRIYDLDGEGHVRTSGYGGQLKMVLLYKKQKIVIHAVTGDLDGDRSTKASPNYFTLPAKVRDHLVGKMKKMYDDDVFGFDNSYQFVPRK